MRDSPLEFLKLTNSIQAYWKIPAFRLWYNYDKNSIEKVIIIEWTKEQEACTKKSQNTWNEKGE